MEHWLKLTDEDAPWVEWGEDFTKANAKTAQSIQAKDLSYKISLGQQRVQKIISRALERGEGVTTTVWTSASIGAEKGKPFGEAGIEHWRRVVRGEVDAGGLVTFLLARKGISAQAGAVLRACAAADIPSLLRRVVWIADEPRRNDEPSLVGVEKPTSTAAVRQVVYRDGRASKSRPVIHIRCMEGGSVGLSRPGLNWLSGRERVIMGTLGTIDKRHDGYL